MPQRKDSSGKAWNDACDFRVQVGMVKIYFLFPGLVQCEECDHKVGVGDCLKYHKQMKHEDCALDADLFLNCFIYNSK